MAHQRIAKTPEDTKIFYSSIGAPGCYDCVGAGCRLCYNAEGRVGQKWDEAEPNYLIGPDAPSANILHKNLVHSGLVKGVRCAQHAFTTSKVFILVWDKNEKTRYRKWFFTLNRDDKVREAILESICTFLDDGLNVMSRAVELRQWNTIAVTEEDTPRSLRLPLDDITEMSLHYSRADVGKTAYDFRQEDLKKKEERYAEMEKARREYKAGNSRKKRQKQRRRDEEDEDPEGSESTVDDHPDAGPGGPPGGGRGSGGPPPGGSAPALTT